MRCSTGTRGAASPRCASGAATASRLRWNAPDAHVKHRDHEEHRETGKVPERFDPEKLESHDRLCDLCALRVDRMTIKTIGVVGAGTMGNGIAQVFAQAGFSVRLVDVAEPMLERARTAIQKSLGKFVDKGKLTAADRDAILGRVTTTTTIEA